MTDSDQESTDSTPARLLITRNSERDAKQRQIFVSLDGERVGDIVFGESLKKDIAPGRHFVRIHNTLFWKTIDFEAAPGETIHFNTVNRTGKGFLHLVLILGVAPMFLEVERMKA
ncbi:MAG: hypothetical protein U0Q11_02295 [Vicinamibacterales bacterium]